MMTDSICIMSAYCILYIHHYESPANAGFHIHVVGAKPHFVALGGLLL